MSLGFTGSLTDLREFLMVIKGFEGSRNFVLFGDMGNLIGDPLNERKLNTLDCIFTRRFNP